MTLWVHVLEGRQLTSHEDDHSLMNQFASELDAVCNSIAVAPLSSFFDYTDLNANLSEDEVDYDSEEVNPETGWPYSIDDMAWFPAKEGLSVLSSVQEHLIADGLQPVSEEVVSDLLGEIESCIAKLVGPASRDAKFHFAVLM